MQMSFSTAITSQDAVQYPITFKIGFQQNSPGAIAENNTGAPVAIVHDGTHFIGAHHDHFFIPAAFNQ